ncbi:MAG TPA: cytochrome b N-terminal domain-containing protein [Nitrospirales bacterium]|nr:quinol:cytochrome C oxidoreductase [Nitrospiraceae bacterium]HNP28544.1 cytochrome b N-terminal domain-containing protein [Nitrospirales bacterium]
MASRLYQWIDHRLKLKPLEQTLLNEPIPGGASWNYVFGSATLFLFGLQALTGMFLMIYYVPATDHAYDTVQYIQQEVWGGWFVRGLHHWGASAVMVAIGLHMLQVFFDGAYKRPRELMWVVGVLLLAIMLGFGFTGYLLPWDQNAYWATQVGINMVGSVPFIGDFLVKLLRGGETLGALTISRFFAIHVAFLPAIIVFGIMLHLFILRRVGPAGPHDEARAKSGSETFYPRQVFMDAVVMLVVFGIVSLLAYSVEFPLADRADPSDHTFIPVPEWYFLFFYQLLKYAPGQLGPLATWLLPTLFFIGLLLLPFVDRNPERHPSSRPIVLGTGLGFLVVVFGLLSISLRDLYAVPKRDPSVVRGIALVQQLNCQTCHRIHGEGANLAPDLSFVANRRPDRNWHLQHFKDPQSVSPGSFMPKFPLNDQQLNDLTNYMLTLKSG